MAATASRSRQLPYFAGSDESKARGLFQLLREDGTVVDDDAIADIDRTLARKMFEAMLRIRVTDARMMALQRQGRIGFYGEALGQEGRTFIVQRATPDIDRLEWKCGERAVRTDVKAVYEPR